VKSLQFSNPGVEFNARYLPFPGAVRKALVLGDALLKTVSERSFTIRKLRFLGCVCLPDLRPKAFFTHTLVPVRKAYLVFYRDRPWRAHPGGLEPAGNTRQTAAGAVR